MAAISAVLAANDTASTRNGTEAAWQPAGEGDQRHPQRVAAEGGGQQRQGGQEHTITHTAINIWLQSGGGFRSDPSHNLQS
jgi:hypothetical protein